MLILGLLLGKCSPRPYHTNPTTNVSKESKSISLIVASRYPRPYSVIHATQELSFDTAGWATRVKQYPIYAEYAEGRVANESSGVSDTGLTMRAFLPVDSDGNKSLIHTYRGPATVVDARVVCVRPNITNLEVQIPEMSDVFTYQRPPVHAVLHGNLSIPLDILHAAASARVSIGPYTEFNCTFPTGLDNRQYQKSDWNLTLCLLDRVAGMLRTDFFTTEDPPPEELWSHLPHQTYLLANFTNNMYFQNASILGRMFNESTSELAPGKRNDWAEIYSKESEGFKTDATLSFSMCFPAIRSRFLNISCSTEVPLVEPRYKYDRVRESLRFDDIRTQLLSSDGSMRKRGVLLLEPQSWTMDTDADDPFQPYMSLQELAALLDIPQCRGARTVYLLNQLLYHDQCGILADISTGGLLLEVLREGGTTAEAVQSMIMGVYASRYQEYYFMEVDEETYTRRADFVAVQIPGGQGLPAHHCAGATRPYILVLSAIVIHFLTVCYVFILFIKGL
jgi:hypothetical protein